jgi:hypothetical protein
MILFYCLLNLLTWIDLSHSHNLVYLLFNSKEKIVIKSQVLFEFLPQYRHCAKSIVYTISFHCRNVSIVFPKMKILKFRKEVNLVHITSKRWRTDTGL